jgi:predicted MFS family arabinose efflux permease
LFIGIQSYVLAVASPERKTQAAAIIVFGFQGGMISGMAIGSLLVSYLHPQGVFIVSGAIGLVTALYSLVLVPAINSYSQINTTLQGAMRRLTRDLAAVARSGEFLRTMICIGIPAKAILTGAVTFALPLILSHTYRQEEIGQIIMLYGLGVVAASGYVSKVVDRTKSTELVLFWGTVMSGMGLLLVGLMGSPLLGNGPLSTLAVILGVIVIGLAHGFINAPVVTHVAHSRLATEIGVNPVTTTYRFLERLGHIAGPFAVGQMFLVWGQRPVILAWIGIGAAVLGLLFIIGKAPAGRVAVVGPEGAR